MSGADWLIIAAIVVLVIVAGVFALAETSFTRMTRIKALTLEEESKHNRRARLLHRLVQHPERSINPILLVVLFCHIVASALLGVVTERHFGAAGLAIGIVIELVIIFTFAEAAPKTWAIQHTEQAALMTAPIVGGVATFPPIRGLARAPIR